MMKILFDYVVLDESQAIKNPASKVTKAACLLTARNRLCMSGTPLQNNTFDVYAQMNFLNPGLLGSVEFFRNEFSTPIDKIRGAGTKGSPAQAVISIYFKKNKRTGCQGFARKNRNDPFLRDGR